MLKLRVSRYDGKTERGRTVGVLMTTDVRSESSVDWGLLANPKPKSVLRSNSPSLFSKVSYPHPWREFKLLKREVVYNFDATKSKARYLRGKKITS